ncbi:MAG: hypothetical protein PVH19_04290 [Planctomycetia bacterium]|jgi:hypothetical protein
MKRIISVLILVVLVCSSPALADSPAPSTFAPAKDLAAQVSDHIKKLEKSTASEEDYQDLKTNAARDANTLAVVALTLGLHDTDNEYKKAAPALIKACQQMAEAKDYAASKAGLEAIKKAIADKSGDPSTLKWEKVANLKELMEAVPLLNTKLKKYTRPSRLKRKADVGAGYSAVIAAIAQGSIANAKDTEKPNEVEAWEKHCVQMREAASKTNKAFTAKDADKVKAAMEELQQSCDDCHKIFHDTEATKQK